MNEFTRSVHYRFKYLRELFHLTQEEFGELLGVARTTITRIESGTQEPSEALIKIMEYAFQLNREWLLEGKGDVFLRGAKMKVAGDAAQAILLKDKAVRGFAGFPEGILPLVSGEDFVFVPRYDVAASTAGGQDIHNEQVVDFLAFKFEWVRDHLHAAPDNLILISALGDSMAPTIEDGDLLLVDTGKNVLSSDGIYCFTYDSFLSAKRLQRLPDGVVAVKCDNPGYQDYSLSPERGAELRIIGRVVWKGGKI